MTGLTFFDLCPWNSETIDVYGINVRICSKLNEYMDQRSRSFFDLCPWSHSFETAVGTVTIQPYIIEQNASLSENGADFI